MTINIDPNNSNKTDIDFDNDLAEKARKVRLEKRIANIIDSSSYALFLLAYVILALVITKEAPSGNSAWAVYWTIILLGGVPGGIYRCITEKKICIFPIWALASFAYLFMGMYANMWNPYWVILLLIPVFYSIGGPIDSLRSDHQKGRI